MKKLRAVPGLLLLAATAILCVHGSSRADGKIVYDDGRYGPQVWRYTGAVTGQFATNGNGAWVETNTQATFHFREVAREQGFIELYDESRDVTVRLYDDTSSIRLPGTGGQFVYLYSRLREPTRQDTAPPSSALPPRMQRDPDQFPDFVPESVPTDDGDEDEESPAPGR